MINDAISYIFGFTTIQYLTFLNLMTGMGFITLVLKTIDLYRQRNKIGRTKSSIEKENRELVKKNNILKKNESKYEDLISKENSDFNTFMQCLPDNKDAAHALLHELVEISPIAHKTEEHGIKYESENSESRRFINSVCVLISQKYLIHDREMHCARNILAQKLLNEVVYLNIKDPVRNYNGKYIQDIDELLNRTQTLWEMSKDTGDFHTKDLVVCSKFWITLSRNISKNEKDELMNDAMSMYDYAVKDYDGLTLEIMPNMFLLQMILADYSFKEDDGFKEKIEQVVKDSGIKMDINIKNAASMKFNLSV